MLCVRREILRESRSGSFNHQTKRIGNSLDGILSAAIIPEFEVALCIYQLSMQYSFMFGSQEVAEVETRWLKACS
jgi:hypothetical protein